MIGARCYVVDQQAGDGDLVAGLLAQRHPDGIAYAIGKQRAYAYGRFDTAVFAVTGFGNAKMQGVVHIFGIHRFYKHSHGFYHDDGIGCLDRENNIIEIGLAAYPQVFEARLYHAPRRIAVAAHDAV